MSSFSKVIAGTRARKSVELLLVNGDKVNVDLRMLTPMETVTVVEAATKFAKERNAAECADGNPIYDLGTYVHTLAIACLDPEEKDKEVPFFDGGAQQILDSQLLARDTIAYLFALYESHVDEIALSRTEWDEKGLRAMIETSAEGDMLPFSKLRPSMQWSFVHFMARQVRNSLKDSLSFGSGSASGSAASKISASESPAPEATNGVAED